MANIGKIRQPYKLPPMRKKFLKEYIKNGCNGKAAALAAGYSANSATQIAHMILKDERIIEYLQKVEEGHRLKEIEDVEDMLDMLDKMAGTTVKDFIECIEMGRAIIFKNMDEVPEEAWLAADSVKETSHGLEIKLLSRHKTLELYARIKGWTKEETTNHNITETYEEYLRRTENDIKKESKQEESPQQESEQESSSEEKQGSPEANGSDQGEQPEEQTKPPEV